MPRPKTNINTVIRRKPDGVITEVVYYHLATGARIGSSKDGMTREHAIAIANAVAQEPTDSGPRRGSFDWLASCYLGSIRFAERKPKTQLEYRRYIEHLRARWGYRPADAITRADVAAFLIERRETPYEANAAVRVLRLLYNWGRKELHLACPNPSQDPELHETTPRTAIWSQEQITQFVAAAPADIALAMSLLLYTVQRPSDVLHMTADQVREMHNRLWLVLRQEKTKELVAVPCLRALDGPLRRRLAEIQSAVERVQGDVAHGIDRPSLLLVPGPGGRAWSQRSFATAWDRALRRANHQIARQALRGQPLPKKARQRASAKQAIRARLLTGLQRRDIRRTGMVQLALAGATIPQIAALSGHSVEHTTRIIETYVPRRADIALAGVEVWERRGREVLSSLADDLKAPSKAAEHLPNQTQQKNNRRT